ncbi:MAG: hypothetical protein R2879_19440 [Saprospiraceae bacterium]
MEINETIQPDKKCKKNQIDDYPEGTDSYKIKLISADNDSNNLQNNKGLVFS